MIKFKNASFLYKNGQRDAGMRDVSLNIPEGQVVVLCGESGCGKTTLTRMINGLVPHFYEGEMSGEVFVCGNNVAECELYQLAYYVGSVFQNPKAQFYTVKTDTEVVFTCENLGMEKQLIFERFENIVEALDITALLGKSLFSLSGGEKQRVACASATAPNPPIVVMDEPTSNLDTHTIAQLRKIIKKWKQDRKTVIIAEHRLEWLMDLADRVIYMKNGRIINDYTIEQFKKISKEQLKIMGLRSKPEFQKENRATDNAGKIEFVDFSYTYKGEDKPAFSIPYINLPEKSIIGIVGNNGAGKSTFGRAFCGLEKRSKGDIFLNGESFKRKNRIESTYIVMQDVNQQLFTESVFEEVRLSMERLGLSHEEQEKKTNIILKELGLEEFKDSHPMSLSGGQKQRVAMASALASDKRFLLYDEPTSGLDYIHMIEVADAIKCMKAAGRTQFVITHDSELVSRCCDYILFLECGEVKCIGNIDDMAIQETLQEFWNQVYM